MKYHTQSLLVLCILDAHICYN